MFVANRISYKQASVFSPIVLDYLAGAPALRPFYHEPPGIDGVKRLIQLKKSQPVDRSTLVAVLGEQYRSVASEAAVVRNIEMLQKPNTFTITTAHQPNLFTGPLYFIYKILHAIRIAEDLNHQLPEFHFVPVYYMGSEDADFAELNHTYVAGKKIEWNKVQSGAVGRMLVDKTLIALIDELEGQLGGEAHGQEVIAMLRNCYQPGRKIQDATFELVHQLYGRLGLIVLIPDNPQLKASMHQVFTEELFEHKSAAIVEKTSSRLGEIYNVQAHPREINLFYLKDQIRERIIAEGDSFLVHNTNISFTADEMKAELKTHPERFSPNVILRGLYQETILPNLIFVGGGGELAYWLQLKDLFAHYNVVYPMLVLRNSFLVMEAKWRSLASKLDLEIPQLFRPENELMLQIVSKRTNHEIFLNGEKEKAVGIFEKLKVQAGAIDRTLEQHVDALKTQSLKKLNELEKKMIRAEKKKFASEQAQLMKLKTALFPNNGLQERVENFSSFYARWGQTFIDELYANSPSFRQEFTVLSLPA